MAKNTMNSKSLAPPPRHLQITAPSPWVTKWAHLIAPNGHIVDLAAGGGRHGRLFLHQNHPVTFVDKAVEPLADLQGHSLANIIQADLEDGSPWPLAGQKFDGIIVVNYLCRPLMRTLLDSLKPNGVLIYETFALGNEDFARPRNPEHLLKAGELLSIVQDKLHVVAFEQGLVKTGDIPGVKQRLCAVNTLHTSKRPDGEPIAQTLTPQP